MSSQRYTLYTVSLGLSAYPNKVRMSHRGKTNLRFRELHVPLTSHSQYAVSTTLLPAGALIKQKHSNVTDNDDKDWQIGGAIAERVKVR